MRIISLLPLLVGVLVLAAAASADDTVTALACPWYDEGAGLSIGGWQIDAGMSMQGSVENGVILGTTELYQQTGEPQQTTSPDPGDTVIDGQGYSVGLHGQGSWTYQGGWNVTGNDVTFDQLLVVKKGRLNPSEETLMMNWVCPPSEVYSDNMTHPVGEMTAAAWNRADIFSGGYATQGSASPGSLIENVAVAGMNGQIIRGGGYNAYLAIARNVTETYPVTTMVMVGNQSVAVTTMVTESQNVVTPVAHTTLQSEYSISGDKVDYLLPFHFVATRSSPYQSPE